MTRWIAIAALLVSIAAFAHARKGELVIVDVRAASATAPEPAPPRPPAFQLSSVVAKITSRVTAEAGDLRAGGYEWFRWPGGGFLYVYLVVAVHACDDSCLATDGS